MEPTTVLILAALAGAAGKAIVSEAAKDSYNRLKFMIKSKFSGDKAAEELLEGYELNPKELEESMKVTLEKFNATKDEDIIKASQDVLSHINPQQVSSSKYNSQISANVIHNIVQGDNTQVTVRTADSTDDES